LIPSPFEIGLGEGARQKILQDSDEDLLFFPEAISKGELESRAEAI
jgi:hypothetical protein